jgi:hypothetical protein
MTGHFLALFFVGGTLLQAAPLQKHPAMNSQKFNPPLLDHGTSQAYGGQENAMKMWLT